MANLKHIKNLKTGNANVFDLLVSFVFGKIDLDIYRPQKTYYENDSIIRLNDATGKYDVLRCLDTTTGTFVPAKWSVDNIHDSTSSEFIDAYTLITPVKPTNTLNRVWHQQIRTRGTIDPESFI